MTISSGYGKIKVHSAGVVALRKEETDMSNEERILFKDKITKKEYTVLVKELLNAIDMGEDVLKKFLLAAKTRNYILHMELTKKKDMTTVVD